MGESKRKKLMARAIAALARMDWKPKFHKVLDNPTVPGGKVAMWLMLDDDTGEGIVSIACPPDRPDIPAYIADCCANPWFTAPDDDGKSLTGLAIKINDTLKKYYGADGECLDAHEVTLACMTIITAYLQDVPVRARVELVNKISAQLQPLREGTFMS